MSKEKETALLIHSKAKNLTQSEKEFIAQLSDEYDCGVVYDNIATVELLAQMGAVDCVYSYLSPCQTLSKTRIKGLEALQATCATLQIGFVDL